MSNALVHASVFGSLRSTVERYKGTRVILGEQGG